MFSRKMIYIILGFSLILFTVFYIFIPQFVSIVAGILLAIIGCWLLTLIDDFVLVGIDTVNEIKQGNKAYAIYTNGFAYIIASGIIAGFLAFVALSIK